MNNCKNFGNGGPKRNRESNKGPNTVGITLSPSEESIIQKHIYILRRHFSECLKQVAILQAFILFLHAFRTRKLEDSQQMTTLEI